MKELKLVICNDINKGFNEINQLINVYKYHIENLNGKIKDDEIESYVSDQIETLKSLSISHFSRIQDELVKKILDLKNKKEV